MTCSSDGDNTGKMTMNRLRHDEKERAGGRLATAKRGG